MKKECKIFTPNLPEKASIEVIFTPWLVLPVQIFLRSNIEMCVINSCLEIMLLETHYPILGWLIMGYGLHIMWLAGCIAFGFA